ncbi:MAG TPA: D-glycerate dehydrogenase [Trueperaceae bacterium]|nr:D-glycerate dehydrogenase [Trueperaceae bacterium]
MSLKVFVTRRLPEAGLAPLREAGLLVEVNAEDEPISRQALLQRVRGAAALITLMSERVDDELLEVAGPQLRVVANYAVGYDNIDVAACRRNGVVATNTPGVLTGATADMAFALLLAVARRLREGDELVRSGEWTGWQPLQLLGAQVSGATLGIVGLGRIGRAVARRARGFDMTVLYHNRNRDEDAESDLGVRYVSLDELLELSDFVSLHAPLTQETRHMIAAAELRRMKPSAVLINTARGAVVDEADLVEALRDGTIAGAGLDVFEEEPAVHPGLAPLPSVVLAPHLGSATLETRTEMALLCSRAIVDVLAGRQPPNAITA